MSTNLASSSTSTILGKGLSRGTKRMNRTIRRLQRRILMMSPSARAGTRSSLFPTTECLSGLTTPREILSSSHSGWEISRPPQMGQIRLETSLPPRRLGWRLKPWTLESTTPRCQDPWKLPYLIASWLLFSYSVRRCSESIFSFQTLSCCKLL